MLERISSQYSHAVIKCCSERCYIGIARSPKVIILKGEWLDDTHSQKMCDCVIFREDGKIVVVELKSRRMDPRSIHEKLKNGARFAMKIWSGISTKPPQLFFAVVAKSFPDHTAYNRISRDRIVIGGKKHGIRTAKCGCGMTDIVREYV